MSHRGIYKIKTVASMTGFSPILLRAWEARHGVLAPQRTSHGHRLFTKDDLKVLYRIRELLNQGRSIGEIALMGRKTLLAHVEVNGCALQDEMSAQPSNGNSAMTASAELYLIRAELVHSAVKLDGPRLHRTLNDALSVAPAEAVISQVLEPAIRDVDELCEADNCSFAGRNLLYATSRHQLYELILAAQARLQTEYAAPVICACLPEQTDEFRALNIVYRLTRLNKPVVYLGPLAPRELECACEISLPRAIYIFTSHGHLWAKHTAGLRNMIQKCPLEVVIHLDGLDDGQQAARLDQKHCIRLWTATSTAEEIAIKIVTEGYRKPSGHQKAPKSRRASQKA